MKVAKREFDSDPTLGYALMDMYTVYCPKCRKQKEVDEYGFETLMNRQLADEEHKKSQEEKL
ncbi:MAG: hypothetical protein ACRC4N_00180 [Gammaproteobacteria bacterium]